MTQIIFTGVSGSWKTTLMNKLVNERDAVRPIQFTTRKPRNDNELDEYVFLTKEQFITKLENGDFIEYVYYNWEYYAITKYFDRNVSNIFIVEPTWKSQIIKYFKSKWIKYISFFIELSEENAKERMENRWDTVQKIESRLEDFKYFCPEANDIVLDWRISIEKLSAIVKKYAHL